MTKFYSMCGKSSKKWAVARTDKALNSLALWELIESIDHPSQWPGLHLNLGDGELTDLPPTNAIGRVCSPKLMNVMNSFSADVTWLSVTLHRESDEWGYHLLHFTSVPDVLNVDKTVFVDGSVFTPHLSLAKASQMPLFCLRRRGASTIVRQDVKEAIESTSCVGIEFQKVAVS